MALLNFEYGIRWPQLIDQLKQASETGDWTAVASRLEERDRQLENRFAFLPRRMAYGLYTKTTDASGYITWNHNVGRVPSAVFVEGQAPIAGPNIPANHITDSYTDTTVRTRFMDNVGAPIASTSISFHVLAIAY